MPPLSRLAVLLFCVGCLTACSREIAGPVQHVVLIVIDTTHAAHLGCYGGPDGVSPAIDRLASRGVRFDRAFSNHTWTLPSTASLFTGRIQERHGVVIDSRRVPASMRLLPERFRDAGFRTAGFVQMIYASSAYGLDRGFDHYVYYGSRRERHAETVPDVLDWVDGFEDGPTFTYVHLRRPHSPYDPDPDLLEPLDRGCALSGVTDDIELRLADGLGTRRLPRDRMAHVEHLYRANLATVDRELAPLIDRLLAREDTVVILTSDHGEELGQHGYFGHGPGLFAEAIDIPLIVFGPGIEPGVDAQPACTVDILPTLLDLCGVDRPVDLDGRSLANRLLDRSDTAPRGPVPISARYAQDGRIPLVGVIKGDLKLIVFPSGRHHLFDRAHDPRDLRDLAGGALADEKPMLRFAREFLETHRDVTRGAFEPVQLSEQDIEDLRAMGYVR